MGDLTNLFSTSGNWVVSGDFNTIRCNAKKWVCIPKLRVVMEDFNACIQRCELIDIPFKDSKYSYCKGSEGNTRLWARLDRTLVSPIIVSMSNVLLQKYLAKVFSDHSPMVISEKYIFKAYDPAPFKCLRIWSTHQDLQRVITESCSQPMYGSGMIKLEAKVKRPQVLKKWNIEVSGRIDKNIQKLEDKLLEMEARLGANRAVEVGFLGKKDDLEMCLLQKQILLK